MSDALELVLCRSANWHVGLEAQCVRQSRHCTDEDLIHPSLANHLQLTEFEERAPSHLLDLQGCALTEIRVDGPLQLLSVSAQQLHPLPPLLSKRCRLSALRGLLWLDRELVLLLRL